MIDLVYSNHLEELTEALGERLSLARSRPGASLFDTVHLVTPSRHIEAYVKARLASSHGVAFNMRCYQLDRLLTELLASCKSRWNLLDLPALRGLLLSSLLDGGKGREELSPVSDYVHGRDHRDDAAELRKFQLATELSLVFYEYNRAFPALFDAWKAGQFADGSPTQEERWQRAVWDRVFGRGGILEQRQREGQEWVSFEELVTPGSSRSLRALRLPPEIHIVGLSHGGTSMGRLLSALADGRSVHVYSLNPCAEFWEDVPNVTRKARPPVPLAIPEEPDTPLLRLWGRPGREGARVLNELSNYDFEERYREPARPTLLAALQDDVLRRAPERTEPDDRLSADRSLCVLACPGVRREVEVIASEIWELIKKNPSLKFHDIAVVVGPRDAPRYLPQIASVFAETGALPFNVIDLPMATDSRVVEAVELLLSLPFGGFARQEMLRLCTHPLLASRFPDDDPEEWIRWCDGVGIVRGADRSDLNGTYVTRDLFNWEQGVRRLALGAFLTGERSGDDRSFFTDGESYLPEEHTQAGQLGAGRFGMLVRSLIADARFARQGHRTIRQWVKFMTLMATSYLAPTSEQEEKELVRCVTALQSVDDGSMGDSVVSYRLAYQLALSALAEQQSTRGQLLSGGVAVGPLSKLRGLPFEVVFVAGLNEGRFPEIERKSALDLRVERQSGSDSGSQRERDKYAFFELMLSARQAFYMSYVHRDLFTQEELQPSSVVLDLLDVLRRGYLPRTEIEKVTEKHRLRRFDPVYFPDVYLLPHPPVPCWQPEARREAQSVELRRQMGQGGSLSVAALRTIEKKAPAAWGQIKHHLRLYDLPDAALPAGDLRLRATHLRRFLECPLQGYAQFALGLVEEEEDAMAVEDEPFATSVPQAVGQLRAWLAEALVTGVEPARVYDRRVEVLEQRGKAPTGVFADVEQQTHRAWLRCWYERARKLLGDGVRSEVVRFGASEEHGYDERVEPLVTVDAQVGGQTVQVSIAGVTSPLLRSRRGSMIFVHRPHENDDDRQEKLFLRSFFDHVLLAASGRTPAHHTACVVYADGTCREVTFLPVEPDEARAYLGRLVSDLLSGPHTYLLPCEAAFAVREREGATVEDLVEQALKKPGCSSRLGPIQRIDAFAAPPEDTARAMVSRRFGPFFARVTPET